MRYSDFFILCYFEQGRFLRFTQLTSNKYPDPSRERNRLCIEVCIGSSWALNSSLSHQAQDPFEIDFNVARCVTKDGLYTARHTLRSTSA
jgi:hypothetical protein